MRRKLISKSKGNRKKKNDVKLIMSYLGMKVRGEPLPPNVDIPEVNLYGDTEPSELFDRAKSSPGKPILVFTTLTKKTAKRMVRTCGSGNWDGRTARKKVKLDNGVVLGEKKIFTFAGSKSSDGDSDKKKEYVSMSEYSPLPKDKDAGPYSGYVICNIVYKASSNRKREPAAMTTTLEEKQPLVIEKRKREKQPLVIEKRKREKQPLVIGKRKRSEQKVDEEDEPAMTATLEEKQPLVIEKRKRSDQPVDEEDEPAMTATVEEKQPLVIEKRNMSDQQADEDADADYDEWMFKRMKKLSTRLHESIRDSQELWFVEEEEGIKDDEKALREEWKNASPFAKEMSLLLLGSNFD